MCGVIGGTDAKLEPVLSQRFVSRQTDAFVRKRGTLYRGFTLVAAWTAFHGGSDTIIFRLTFLYINVCYYTFIIIIVIKTPQLIC